ncbi:hypothetical protein Tco_1443552, partial [Tanacetum coccineum]
GRLGEFSITVEQGQNDSCNVSETSIFHRIRACVRSNLGHVSPGPSLNF